MLFVENRQSDQADRDTHNLIPCNCLMIQRYTDRKQ